MHFRWRDAAVAFCIAAVLAGCGAHETTRLAPAPQLRAQSTSTASGMYERAVLADDPSQFFPLDETGGSLAVDDAAGGADGSYAGSFLYAQPGPLLDESSAAIALDAGALNVGALLPAPSAPAGTSYSIETWVYPVLDRTYSTIWGYSATHRLLVSPQGRLLSQFAGNFFSTQTLTNNAWHDVVFVYDAQTSMASYYIDGALDGSASISNAAAAFTQPYDLGQYGGNAYYKWHGRIADQAFYYSALRGQQIDAHYSAAGYPAANATPTAAPTSAPLPDSPCGGYRWDVKVAQDANAGSIALSAVDETTISALTGVPQPSANNTLPRMSPAETTLYQLTGVTLIELFKGSDSDYHLVLGDGAGRTIIAEAPDPACAPNSTLSAQIASVRQSIDARYPNLGATPVKPGTPISLQGVGFFDNEPNYATDQSPDGIELHPITAICFGANCALTTPAASPSATPSPSATAAPPASPSPASSEYDAAILALGPAQYFKLDEPAGPTAYDSSQNADNGAYMGTETFDQPGPLRGQDSASISLAGGSAIGGVALPAPPGSSGSYTLVTWVYPIFGSSYMTIWGNGYAQRLLVSSNGTLLSQFDGNFFSSAKLTGNAWHMIAFVYDGSAGMATYYIDGTAAGSTNLSAASAAFTSSYFLGQYDNSGNYKWHGLLAQHTDIPSALTSAQVGNLYANAGY